MSLQLDNWFNMLDILESHNLSSQIKKANKKQLWIRSIGIPAPTDHLGYFSPSSAK